MKDPLADSRLLIDTINRPIVDKIVIYFIVLNENQFQDPLADSGPLMGAINRQIVQEKKCYQGHALH